MAQAPQVPAHDMSSHGRSSPPQTAQAGHVTGAGTVNSVDAAGRRVTLAHNAIPSIGWPAMTMEFAVAPSVDLGSVKPGTRIDFTMMQGSGGMYVIQSIKAQGGQ
jgi:Cu/Ag efflux protein CusF